MSIISRGRAGNVSAQPLRRLSAVKTLEAFLFYRESDRWLGILRTGLGVELILFCISLRGSWLYFFGPTGTGLLGSEASEAMLLALGVTVPTMRWITVPLGWVGISPIAALNLVWFALLLAGLLLIAGLFCRGSAIGAWFLHLCVAKSGGFVSYGLDNLITIGLFYLMLSPLPDAASLDAKWRKKLSRNPELLGFFRRVLQVHLCFIYFFGGLTKALGAGWWDGSSIWRALIRPPFNVIPGEWIAPWHAFLPLLGISVWAIELGYVFFIWPRRTRLIWLGLVCAMHIGIALAMGMPLFGLIMIVLNLAAFAPVTARGVAAESRAS